MSTNTNVLNLTEINKSVQLIFFVIVGKVTCMVLMPGAFQALKSTKLNRNHHMDDTQLTQIKGSWREKIEKLQALLADLKPELIAAEAELAERLAAISAFEFQVRVRLEPLTRRLESIIAEVHNYRGQLRQLQEDWLFLSEASEEARWAWQDGLNFSQGAAAAESGDFRYRKASQTMQPPIELSEDEIADLKQLYRRLARRFHPDFALDEADRTYRTQLMMAINAAYALGDLTRLEEIEQEPDRNTELTYNDQELAEALWREVTHCQRRLKEIGQEFTRLDAHESTHLMQRVAAAAKVGRDLLEELAQNIREKISNQLIERDILKVEIDAFLQGETDITSEEFAKTIYDLGLEQAIGEDPDSAFSEWRDQYHGDFDLDDEPTDESWLDRLREQRKDQKRGNRKSRRAF